MFLCFNLVIKQYNFCFIFLNTFHRFLDISQKKKILNFFFYFILNRILSRTKNRIVSYNLFYLLCKVSIFWISKLFNISCKKVLQNSLKYSKWIFIIYINLIKYYNSNIFYQNTLTLTSVSKIINIIYSDDKIWWWIKK